MKKLTLVMLFLLVGIGMVIAQTRKVTGIVISAEDNEPIIGASVMAKGTTIGTVTDVNGTFSLEIPNATKVLTFSFVGMVGKDVPVQNMMRVVLNTALTELDEVMIVAYGTAKKIILHGFGRQYQVGKTGKPSSSLVDKGFGRSGSWYSGNRKHRYAGG